MKTKTWGTVSKIVSGVKTFFKRKNTKPVLSEPKDYRGYWLKVAADKEANRLKEKRRKYRKGKRFIVNESRKINRKAA
jgi:hypothetical protein